MAYDRTEFDAFWASWLDVNRHAQDSGDWGVLGFQGWIYPYQTVLFDDRPGQAFGLWPVPTVLS